MPLASGGERRQREWEPGQRAWAEGRLPVGQVSPSFQEHCKVPAGDGRGPVSESFEHSYSREGV